MGRPKRQKLSAASIDNGGQLKSGQQSGVSPLPPPTKKIVQPSAGEVLGNQDQPAAIEIDGGPDSEKRLAAPKSQDGAGARPTVGRPKRRSPDEYSRGLGETCTSAPAEKVQRVSDIGFRNQVVSGQQAQLKSDPLPSSSFADSPDMRRIGTWVMRHLDSSPENYTYPAPDGMAIALLSACQTDPKFRSSFIAKVFDRMMVQDAVSTQNKYSDDNADLRKLLDDVSVIAAGCKK